jgi:putative flippase GtrA
MVIAIRYILFAIVSTLANLATQEFVIRVSPVTPLAASMIAGTVVGFAVKYVLDKHWIFQDDSATYTEELGKIFLYGAFSVVTTLIFWAAELASWRVWQSDFAKYSGAIFGLAIGYTAKYLLDRAFVFKRRNQPWNSPGGDASRAMRQKWSGRRRLAKSRGCTVNGPD